MKKLIALLLALTMVFGRVACGGSAAPEAPATEAPKAETEPVPAATTAPAVNTQTSNSNALILGVLAVAAVAVVAFVVLKKKK